MNIGIFDSGLGGLSIFREIMNELPQYNYIYLGDSAHVPYGDRPVDEIYTLTCQCVDWLLKHDCALVIIACNTSSANALRRLQQEYLPQCFPGERVLGVIHPVIEEAIATQYKKVGVIGTEATIRSQSFAIEFQKHAPKIKVFQQPCPLLVPLIEEGKLDSEVINQVVRNYLQPLLDKQIDSLILGCTHYALIQTTIQNIVGDVNIISQAEATGVKLKDYLERHIEIESKLDREGGRKFYFTELNEKYKKLIGIFLGTPEGNFELVSGLSA